MSDVQKLQINNVTYDIKDNYARQRINAEITNCPVEIPQDIKLTITDGSLVLKSGSKVYIPNGAGVFDTVTTSSDITIAGTGTYTLVVYYDTNSSGVTFININDTYAGGSDPGNNTLWYDLTNNNIRRKSTTGTVRNGCSFPIAIATTESGSFTSIQQVFNGIGYIGNVIYSLPGIVGLIPRGRLSNGTLNNVINTTSAVSTLDNSNLSVGSQRYLVITGAGVLSRFGGEYHVTDDGYLNIESTGADSNSYVIGEVEIGSNRLASFKSRNSVNLVDWYDFERVNKVNAAGYANVSLSNLDTGGEKHFMNYTQASNSILEIPQDINLTLSNGTLTLVSGSKVIMPNGANNAFSTINITADRVFNITSNGEYLIYVTGAQSPGFRKIEYCNSGTTDPGTAGTTFYNTSTNIMTAHNSGGNVQVSFPIAKITVSNSVVSSIDQVFNGFGYIGYVPFALPGVRILASNGRNADGSLRNTVRTLTNPAISTALAPGTVSEPVVGWIHPTATTMGIQLLRISRYDEAENYLYSSTTRYAGCWVFEADVSAGRITALRPYTCLHAVDYSRLTEVQCVVETYTSGTNWYRIWSDGWKEQGGTVDHGSYATDWSANVSLLKAFSNNSYTVLVSVKDMDAEGDYRGQCSPNPCNYTTTSFTIYSYGEANRYVSWYACGY